MSTMKVIFPERLSYLMRIEKLSQSELARKIGISQSAICNWLNGKKEPSIESLWKLADYFDVTVDYLIGKEKDWLSQGVTERH